MSSVLILLFFLAIIGGTLLFLRHAPRPSRELLSDRTAREIFIGWPRLILKFAGALLAICAVIAAVYLIVIGLFALVTTGLGKSD